MIDLNDSETWYPTNSIVETMKIVNKLGKFYHYPNHKITLSLAVCRSEAITEKINNKLIEYGCSANELITPEKVLERYLASLLF